MLRITLRNFEDWLYFKNSYSKTNYYRSLFNFAYTYFLGISFNQSTCEDFMRTIDKRVQSGEISASSYNNYLKALKLLIKAQGYKFSLNLKLKKTERGYIQTLEQQEVLKILTYAYASDHRRAVAYHLAVEHGLRFENVRNLKWEDVHASDLFIKKTKMNLAYEVDISNELRDNIETLRNNHPIYVFATRNGLIDRKSFNIFLASCLKATDIRKNITSHKLRHTNATLQSEKGANLKVIKENLGQKRIQTTEGYIHVSRTARKKAIQKIGISKFILSTDEIRAEANKFILYLNQGGCQAFIVPQAINLVITIPLTINV